VADVDSSYRLAVDLGTCHTVAVVRRGGGAPRPLLFDGSPLLASSVYAQSRDDLLVGRDAERMSLVDPAGFEPYPKRRIDDGTVLLGDAEIPVVDLLGAVLRRVLVEARQAGVGGGDNGADDAGDGGSGATVLTCPADWGPQRRAVLLAAARGAGLGQVRLLDEPIAAATYCEQVLGQRVPPGQCLTVFDFGGGTLDLTVVRRDPDGLRVLSVGGLDDLGGVDVDAALVGHLGQLVSLRAPQVWQRLANPGTAAELRERRAFWAEVRAAKEMLSRTAAAPIPLPGGESALYLTREELERVAGPLVDRAVDETRRVLQRAGVGSEQLAAILLVGGSSRIPLAASRLHARFGLAPTVPEQPELPVAYGALLAAAGTAPAPVQDQPRTGSVYRAATPGSFPAPTSPASGSFAPTSPSGYFGQPTSPSVSFATASATPPSGYAPAGGHPSPRPDQDWPSAPAALPSGDKGMQPDAAPRPLRRTGGFALRLTVMVVVILAVLIGGGYAVGSALLKKVPSSLGGGSNPGAVGAGATLDDYQREIALSGGGAGAAIVEAQTLYYADVGTNHTDITAVPTAGGDKKWHTSVPIEPTDLRMTVQSGLLIVDGKSSSADGGKDVRAVLKLDTGALLWKSAWADRIDVAFIGTEVIVETRGAKPATDRFDLLTGKSKWNRPGQGLILIDERRLGGVLTWPAQPTTNAVAPPADDISDIPAASAFHQPLAVDTGAMVELDDSTGRASVLDAATGKPRTTGDVPLDISRWTVFDGMIIGKASSDASPGRDTVVAYQLGNLAKAWDLPQPAGTSIDVVRACGQHLICVALQPSNGDKVVIAYEVSTKREVWRYTIDATDPRWYLLGDRLVLGDGTFASLTDAAILDGATGKSAHPLGDRTHRYMVVAGRGQWAAVQYATANAAGNVEWLVAAVDLASGAISAGVAVGKDQPMEVQLAGDAITVVTADHKLRVLKLPGGPAAK
jgi:molecular chaperone HscA